MDPIAFGVTVAVFTVFGYVWGRGGAPSRSMVETIVGSTMDKLERDGYLKSRIINGEPHYIKWPKNDAKDL
jgi:hypothetical protein